MIIGLKPTVEVSGKNIAFEIILMNRYDDSLDNKLFMLFTLAHVSIFPIFNTIYRDSAFLNGYDKAAFFVSLPLCSLIFMVNMVLLNTLLKLQYMKMKYM